MGDQYEPLAPLQGAPLPPPPQKAAAAPIPPPPPQRAAAAPVPPPHRAAAAPVPPPQPPPPAAPLPRRRSLEWTPRKRLRERSKGRKRAHSRPSTSSSGSSDQFASSPYDEPLEEVQERSSSCSTCIFVTIVVLFMVGSCSALLVFAYKVAIGDPPMIAVIIDAYLAKLLGATSANYTV